MRRVDAVVIGGGILGCFTARNLRRWKVSTVLIEKEEDVCTGITRANSAIVYAGYDNKPGTRKAEMTVRGNARMEQLCEELEVPFSCCGSLLVTYDEESVPKLERKLRNGMESGVPGLRLLSGAEAEAMEPMLKPGVRAALYAPSTGTVNPWQLGIAAYENALDNGAEGLLSAEVTGIRRTDDGYAVETKKDTIICKMVFNCAGLDADRIQELVAPPSVRLKLDGAEYLVLDDHARKPERVIFLQAQSCGKGITAIPCVEGNLLISGVRKPMGTPYTPTRSLAVAGSFHIILVLRSPRKRIYHAKIGRTILDFSEKSVLRLRGLFSDGLCPIKRSCLLPDSFSHSFHLDFSNICFIIIAHMF